jgi:hypothetical protein
MSDTFITVPFETDPDTIADTAVEYLRESVPGWEPADGHLEVWLIAALARIASEVATVAAEVPASIFRAFGQQLVGVTPQDGVEATMATIWTARDTLGHVIPAGTQVAYVVSGDVQIVFSVAAEATILPGSSTLSPVTVQAAAVGTASNAVPSGPLQPVDSLAWVQSIASTATSTGGVDPETDTAYQDRLAARLRLLTPRPILPGDFAVLARDIEGVHRCAALDGYDPGDESDDNERMVCVVPLDADGAAVSSTISDAVIAYLDGMREVSFVVNATEPTVTAVDVAFTIAVSTGYVSADVVTAAEAAVEAWLSPATWAGGGESPPECRIAEATVRILTTATVVAAVPGVAYVAALTLDGGAVDVVLPGVAPLPSPGTVAGTAA